jgi:hypothetical protein
MRSSKLKLLSQFIMRHLSVIMVFACLPSASLAAVIETAMIGAQSQMIVKDGRTSICGLRLVVLPQTFRDDSQEGRLMLDTSLVMGREGVVMVKGFAAKTTPEEIQRGEFKKFRLAGLWFKPEGSRATVPSNGQTFVGDDGIALMYTDEDLFSVYTKFVETVVNRRSITIGFRLTPNSDERIVSGTVDIAEPDLATFLKCNSELVH